MREYQQVANAQTLAAQQTLATQQKQSSMFHGGAVYIPPNMGGNNPAAQTLANGLTLQMAKQQSQAINDQRIGGGKHKKYKTIRRKNGNSKKKRNKRITKRKYYIK